MHDYAEPGRFASFFYNSRKVKASMFGLFAKLYAGTIRRRNRRFDEGKEKVKEAPIVVVSVGNITVGGTGKTPFVQMLVRELQSLGAHPAVVARGYGRRSRGEVIVSDGQDLLADVEQAGDELTLHAENLQVPVIANADRHAGVLTAYRHFDCDVAVLDDGFQHRRLHRDCDIVLIDRRSIEDKALLPEGRLREPLAALQRADIVCTVGDVDCESLLLAAPQLSSLCLHAETSPGALKLLFAAESEAQEVDVPLLPFCGIAQPERFVVTAKQAGLALGELLTFDDHQRYELAELDRIRDACRAAGMRRAVCTAKDAVKLQRHRQYFMDNELSVYTLAIEMHLTAGREDFLTHLQDLFEE